MPKRKKMKDYGNKISTLVSETYLNTWSHHKETQEDMMMVSYLLKAEGGSLIQILIAENSLYSGIFHLTKFKFVEGEKIKLIVDRLDDLHDAKDQDYKGLIEQLPLILEKYQGELNEQLDGNLNPLSIAATLPLLVLE